VSQQDVWDAEAAEMRRAFAEKDAEIDRLKAELKGYGEELHNCGKRIADKDKLISELADALSHYALLNNGEKELIRRAKEAVEL
jgi:peptidoglycan hydrolase CwlO-like protein